MLVCLHLHRKLATTVPSVKFVVESDCITVFNNECGFEEKNIRAVCDVGRSTKGKHKYGYIGEWRPLTLSFTAHIGNESAAFSCHSLDSGPAFH